MAGGGFGRETKEQRQVRVGAIIKGLKKKYPDARLALNFSTPLELLVALILAAQCTDERVNLVTATLFRKYRTARDWVGVDRATLEAEVRTTGFYRNKAKAIQACCGQLVGRFDGKVPDRLEDLISLPGVGRKTANILLGNAFGQPGIGVDTHVGRLAQRLGLPKPPDPDKIEFDLTPLVPRKLQTQFGILLQAHGRQICRAAKPNCPVCPINAVCPYPASEGICDF